MPTHPALAPDEIAALCAQAPPAVAAFLVTLLETVAVQDQTITALRARVQELEDQLNRTSHNSHQPPASDGPKKQPRSLRQRTGRRPGGQPGHPGQTLRWTSQPDATVV